MIDFQQPQHSVMDLFPSLILLHENGYKGLAAPNRSDNLRLMEELQNNPRSIGARQHPDSNASASWQALRSTDPATHGRSFRGEHSRANRPEFRTWLRTG